MGSCAYLGNRASDLPDRGSFYLALVNQNGRLRPPVTYGDGHMLETERAEMRFYDDPKDLCRVYLFKVHIPQHYLLKKYFALWHIAILLWKVARHGKQTHEAR